MRRYIVLSGEKYFPIINAALGFGYDVFDNTTYVDSICIVKNKYGFISYTFFRYQKDRDIIVDIRNQLTDKEIDRLLILMSIMGNEEAFSTLF